MTLRPSPEQERQLRRICWWSTCPELGRAPGLDEVLAENAYRAIIRTLERHDDPEAALAGFLRHAERLGIGGAA